MITAVTVAYRSYPEPIICNFLHSLDLTSKLVNEVIVIYGDGRNFEKTERLGNLNIRHISTPPRRINWNRPGHFFSCDYYREHGFALKFGIEKATNDYVLISDPDVVFYMKGFDSLYLDLFEMYNLNFIGVSHYLKTPFHWDFPTVINCLTRKSRLPSPNWMKGELRYRFGSQHSLNNAGWCFQQLVKSTRKYDNWPIVDGEYLGAGFITSRMSDYLARNCFFNTGCNLFLWDKDNGSRSMTFRCYPHGLEYTVHNIYSALPEFKRDQFIREHKNQSLLRHSMGFERSYLNRRRLLEIWLRESAAGLIPIL